MHLVATIQDRALGAYAERLRQLGTEGRLMLAGALNKAGGNVRQETVHAETAQTGLTRDTIDRAQRSEDASAGSLTYTIRSKGGNVRLKYLGARETGGGVTAHPFNQSHFYPHAFIMGGRTPNRVRIRKLNDHVFMRTGVGRKIRAVRSGVVIPAEMTAGQTAAAFEAAVATVVVPAVVTRLGAIVP